MLFLVFFFSRLKHITTHYIYNVIENKIDPWVKIFQRENERMSEIADSYDDRWSRIKGKFMSKGYQGFTIAWKTMLFDLNAMHSTRKQGRNRWVKTTQIEKIPFREYELSIHFGDCIGKSRVIYQNHRWDALHVTTL